MNLILLEPEDFIDEHQVRISGRRYQHILEVHRAELDQRLTVGLRNGKMGKGQLVRHEEGALYLEVTLDSEPPAPLPLTLILGLPRPKMLRRIVQHCTTLGVQRLVLINAVRVEKSFWQTPFLEEASLDEQCVLGLEQARATTGPEILLRKRFKPFVEDELPALAADTTRILAHPYTETPCPVSLNAPTTLVVGPEGGFVPYEVTKLEEAGFTSCHLGARILRVETAVPVLISRLFTA